MPLRQSASGLPEAVCFASSDRLSPHLAARSAVALLQDRRERARPAATRLRLIATLFGRASNVLMVAVAAAVCGIAAWARGGCWLSGAVAAVEVGLLLARCGVILAFKARERAGRGFDPDPWLARFGLLAVCSSLCWGTLCFIALAVSHDPVLYVIPILATVGTAGAVAARNSGVPRLAKLQLAASLGPILVGCLLADDHGFSAAADPRAGDVGGAADPDRRAQRAARRAHRDAGRVGAPVADRRPDPAAEPSLARRQPRALRGDRTPLRRPDGRRRQFQVVQRSPRPSRRRRAAVPARGDPARGATRRRRHRRTLRRRGVRGGGGGGGGGGFCSRTPMRPRRR